MIFDPSSFTNDVLVGDGFFDFFNNIKKMNIQLPEEPEPTIFEIRFDKLFDGATIEKSDEVEDIFSLDVKNGCKLSNDDNILISAYDEAINKYSTLEGKAVYVSHSLIYLHDNKYYPINKLTMLFVTKSKLIANNIPNCIIADKWDIDTTANVEIAHQKRDFITAYSSDNSLLLIDGPFLAGDGLAVFRGIIKERFIDHGIVPIFIVKNSNTSIVVDGVTELKGQYNSDLHWSNKILKAGQRTRFFKYTDKYNEDNSKMFCYMKFYDKASPIRIEIPTAIYLKYLPSIKSFLDIIYYTILEQGNMINPQARPIAVAEMFARETLNLVNFNKDMKNSQLTPTMNENRGMDYEN
ncbi:DNA double-strand break repair nuclease NurA [Candidatus Methanarcanum hacksteinii]|uniref:DNA double-strand break repair nuclease NurA n=1 Tax=Candidatus Methanarcanum hacksteinii TaxID=2911857 RepID=UPI0037DDC248